LLPREKWSSPMSQASTVPATLSVQSRPLASASVDVMAIPRAIWFMVAGTTLTSFAGTWDFAWHFSIGRESQFTPPHVTAQMGGIMVGIACAYTILAMTFASAAPAHDASVRVWGFRAPAGTFIALWGAVTLAASVPFDNWWHNAYGLDVNVINPPHMFVFFGSYAAKIGTMVWIVSIMNRSTGALHRSATRLFLFVGTLGLWQSSYIIMMSIWTNKLHSAACYLAIGPAFLLSLLAVEWPFANFLVSPAARNWFFGTAYLPYFDPAGFLYDPYKFIVEPRPVFLLTFVFAFVASILTVRLGLAWGNWMQRIHR
jgi:hypothetical protein